MPQQNIQNWVKLALQCEDVADYEIEIQGKTGKEDGFIGDITFVKVTGESSAKLQKSFDLVIKASKNSEKLRSQVPVKESFVKEIFMYNKVKRAYDKFQEEKHLKTLQIMPLCYATSEQEGSEVLIFENLKTQNYELWPRELPMTLDHIKLVLTTFGKWHALSFALKLQKPEIYQNLIKDNVNMYSYFISKVNVLDYFVNIFETVKKSVLASDENEILEKLNFTREKIIYSLTDLFFEDPDHQVILHGDCWNNNFLFKFEEDPQRPLDIRILDWQCSGLGSPVIDLSHFIYSCCDNGKHKNVKELLNIYYQSFSEYLGLLGSNSQETFSFDTLLEHWKRFSCYGMILGNYILKACLCETEDIPDWAETADDDKGFAENLNYSVKNETVYFNRVRDNLVHYVYNLA